MEKRRIPGLALIVACDDRLLAARAYGFANLEHRTPTTLETVFEIASVTKPITATGVLLLVENGRVGLDEPIATYLHGLPETWSAITVRHLLSHRSGLQDYLNDRLANRERDQTPRQLAEAVFPKPLRFAPGADWSYSNTNYLLLELLIEGVTGMRYEQFLTERIFRPLGMTATGRRDLRAIVPGRAAHYEVRDGAVVNAPYLNPTVWDHGDGGLVSSARDLFRFEAGLSRGALVRADTLQQMWTAARLPSGVRASYGLGWEIGDARGVRYIGHGGGRAGVSSYLVRYLDARLTVIVLANLSGLNLRREFVEGVAGCYEPTLRPLRERPIQPDPDPQQTERVLAYLRDVASGNRDSPLVTTGNRAAVDAPQRSLTRMLDELISFDSLGYVDVGGRDIERRGSRIERVCNYRLVTKTRTEHLTLYLTVEGRVADQVVGGEGR
jgi:CubicO group peptidase (beta-lactamase class C family)